MQMLRFHVGNLIIIVWLRCFPLDTERHERQLCINFLFRMLADLLISVSSRDFFSFLIKAQIPNPRCTHMEIKTKALKSHPEPDQVWH